MKESFYIGCKKDWLWKETLLLVVKRDIDNGYEEGHSRWLWKDHYIGPGCEERPFIGREETSGEQNEIFLGEEKYGVLMRCTNHMPRMCDITKTASRIHKSGQKTRGFHFPTDY